MTKNYEPTSGEVVDELGGDTLVPDSWIARVLLVVAARERLIKRHDLATGGKIPAPPSTPSGVFDPARAYVLDLSPHERELLQRISDQNSTFDHQGERP